MKGEIEQYALLVLDRWQLDRGLLEYFSAGDGGGSGNDFGYRSGLMVIRVHDGDGYGSGD